jgi:uncharacterized membrane protein YdjX (TVP38/TMEM64 family)
VPSPSSEPTPVEPAAQPPPPTAKQVWADLGPAAPLALLALFMPMIGGFLLIGYGKTVSSFLNAQGPWGVAIYAAAFALLAGLALLPTYAQSVLGGYAFGVEVGIPAALTGFVVGAIIGYEVARRASGDHVLRSLSKHPRLKAVRDAFIDERLGRGFWKTFGIVALLRVPPNSPFAITNLLLASVRVPRLPYILGTAVGMTPRTVAAVVIGAGIARSLARSGTEGGPDLKAQPWWLMPAGIVLSVVVLIVLGLLANSALAKATKNPPIQGGVGVS